MTRSREGSLRSCLRLNITVKTAISQLTGNVRGCTIQSILAKLRSRPGGHGITWMQVKKAVDCLLEDGVVVKLEKGHFADPARMRVRTKTASAAVRASRPTASSNALGVRPGGRKSSTAIGCTCNIPRKDDRDVTSGKMDVNLGDNSLEASLMNADPAVARIPSGVHKTKTNETENLEFGCTTS